MQHLRINRRSAWDADRIELFLRESRIPMRLACHDASGFPLVCSLWFQYLDGALWCACHRNARVVKLLEEDERCGFEIGVNDPPYRGVRGQGEATLIAERAGDVLRALIDRYPVAPDAPLAKWLLGRIDDELAIRLDIKQITAWDYTSRMA